MRATTIWISAIVLYILAALYFVPESYNVVREGSQNPQVLAEKLKKQLIDGQPLGTFSVWDPVTEDMHDDLFTGRALYPDSRPSPLYRHFLELDCAKTHEGELSKAEKKTLQWVNYRCGRAKLPADFFKASPYQHPRGGSWVWYAFQTDKNFSDRSWLEGYLSYLTVFELASVISPDEIGSLWKEVILSLTPGELMPLEEEWQRFVVTTRFIFIRPAGEREKFLVFLRDDFTEALKNSLLEFKPGEYSDCLAQEGTIGCWEINRDKLRRAGNILTAFVAALIALFSLIIFQLWRSRARLMARTAADRLLMVQTLTHELRHPVTGLRLSMEAFRDRYDDLDESLHEEFFRMTQQMQRLQRLIVASEQYLQNDKKDQLFSFKKTEVESFNEFVEDLLDPYQGKIEIGLLPEDRPAYIDPYWLGMCITNLTKNALMHGQKPIRVECESEGSFITVSVIDSGRGLPQGKLNPVGKMSKNPDSPGMGLGLHLVSRIVRMMGGDISYRHLPRPAFTLKMNMEKENEDHSSR